MRRRSLRREVSSSCTPACQILKTAIQMTVSKVLKRGFVRGPLLADSLSVRDVAAISHAKRRSGARRRAVCSGPQTTRLGRSAYRRFRGSGAPPCGRSPASRCVHSSRCPLLMLFTARLLSAACCPLSAACCCCCCLLPAAAAALVSCLLLLLLSAACCCCCCCLLPAAAPACCCCGLLPAAAVYVHCVVHC